MREAAEILRKKMSTWGVVHVDRKLIGKFKFDQAQTIPGPRILFNQVRKGIVFDFFPIALTGNYQIAYRKIRLKNLQLFR